MDPAPGRRRPTRAEHVDERGDVVVGDLLALLDRLDGERRARGSPRGPRPVGPVERLGGGDLDLAPGLHARLVGPDGADLGAGVARDHRERRPSRVMREDRAPARRRCARCRRPTQATGTPGGICAIESSASSPPATDVGDVSGTPITGRSVWAATTPGQRGRQAGAGDDHPQPAHAARSWRSRRRRRGRGARTSRGSRSGCRAPRAPSPPSPSPACRSCEPMTMPTRGASTSMPSNSRLGLGQRRRAALGCSVTSSLHGAQRDVAAQLPARRTAIMSAAAYAASRAAAGVVAERGHVEHAPAGGDDRRRRARAVPAWVTSTPAGTRVEAGDHVARRRATPGSRARRARR